MGTLEEEQIRLFVSYGRPLEPIPVEHPPRFAGLVDAPLPRPARALLLDVYGTLFISASGEVGSANAGSPTDERFLEAYERASGATLPPEAAPVMARSYREALRASHARSRERGVPYPEVDIIAIWRTVLEALNESGHDPAPADVETLAVAWETVANPVWPMPGASRLIEAVRAQGVPMGIVSNAQFYTPLVFAAHLGGRPEEIGFDPGMIVYSYRFGRAKPDPGLFTPALASLRERGIDSQDVLYVGNDMRNDVFAAGSAGCMTALFAGDARSFRGREDDPKVAAISPDTVVTDLADIGRLEWNQ